MRARSGIVAFFVVSCALGASCGDAGSTAGHAAASSSQAASSSMSSASSGGATASGTGGSAGASSSAGGAGGSGGAGGDGGAGGIGGSGASGGAGGSGGGLVGQRIRIVAGNISSGNNQTYDSGEGIRIFQGLAPDIALVQELNYGDNAGVTIRAFVDTAFGPTFDYHRESTIGLPNGVVSRYPILASGEWVDPFVMNRSFVWARIDVPGPIDLWAVSVHLLTTGPTDRNNEATSLVADIMQMVPMGDYVVIGGDLNTKDTLEACLGTLDNVVDTLAPYPDDGLGNSNTNAPRTRPYDYVLAGPDLDAFSTSVVIGQNTFPSGLVFDSRVYSPLADVAPVLMGDSGSLNMQHMAIAKDFILPP